eukprot:CAMPEP_0185613818 /NCGR_PEP_ID=MMETSP0436-20130131/28890_1 /TAXON_ID=626734 ORGANISM="Favella taraikaensis, Strain Fe Narragansett Bay" /NCGR_SAMPLE_ID=MMETSP0436 /ASSEMBLY_ACC=CAM_ASM_000390 /LENGTH=40 /DNA_ID= /DNA_START= /DNA_END= /DNA_ORIENTATION=
MAQKSELVKKSVEAYQALSGKLSEHVSSVGGFTNGDGTMV